MSAVDYAEFAATARELVADAGRAVDLVWLSAGPADLSKPWRGAATPTEMSRTRVDAAFVPHTGADFGTTGVSPDLLQSTQEVALIAGNAGGDDYSAAHAIDDGGVLWRVLWRQVLRPGPLAVLYAFGVAR